MRLGPPVRQPGPTIALATALPNWDYDSAVVRVHGVAELAIRIGLERTPRCSGIVRNDVCGVVPDCQDEVSTCIAITSIWQRTRTDRDDYGPAGVDFLPNTG